MGSLNKTRAELVRMLRDDGFVIKKEAQGHEVWHHPEKQKQVVLPYSQRNISPNIVRSIYRNAGWPYTEKEKRIGSVERMDIAIGDMDLHPLPGLPAIAREYCTLDLLLGVGACADEVIDTIQNLRINLAREREFSDDQKREIVTYARKKSANAACQKYNVKKKLLNQWRQEFDIAALDEIPAQPIEEPRAPEPPVTPRPAPVVQAPAPVAPKREPERVIRMDPDTIERVLYMFAQGMSVDQLSHLYGIERNDIMAIVGAARYQ